MKETRSFPTPGFFNHGFGRVGKTGGRHLCFVLVFRLGKPDAPAFRRMCLSAFSLQAKSMTAGNYRIIALSDCHVVFRLIP